MLGAIESVRESDPEISDSIDDSEVPLGQYPTSTISQKAVLPKQTQLEEKRDSDANSYLSNDFEDEE